MTMTPKQLKDAFLQVDYRVYEDGGQCWLLGMCDDDDPLLLPKTGPVVSEEVLHYALEHARVNKKDHSLCAVLGIPTNTPIPVTVITAQLLGNPPDGTA